MGNYKDNDKIGTVNIYLGDKKIYTENIYIKVNNEKKISSWFKKIF